MKFYLNEDDDDSLLSLAANETFDVLTGKKNIIELYSQNDNFLALLFDPFDSKLAAEEIMGNLILYFEEMEQYEKCSELVKLLTLVKDDSDWLDKLLWSE